MFCTSRSCLGRENLNLEDVFIRLAFRQLCQAFSWFVIGVGGPITLWLGPLLCGCSWVEYESKLHKPQGARFWVVFLHGLWVRSCLQVPTLSPCPDFPQWWTKWKYKPSKPFLLKVHCHSNRNKPGKLLSIRFDLDLIATNTFSNSCILILSFRKELRSRIRQNWWDNYMHTNICFKKHMN